MFTLDLPDCMETFYTGASIHDMRPLPDSYYPGEYDVICGRGRRIYNHKGNENFRKLVDSRLADYKKSITKADKSYILCEVVAQVRALSPYGGFVKKCIQDNRWYEVGDFLSREKTSQAFRDALHDKYRSSNESKKTRRRGNRKKNRAGSQTVKKLDEEDTHNVVGSQIPEGLVEREFPSFLTVQMHSLMSKVTNIRSFSPSRDILLCDVDRDCDESRSLLYFQNINDIFRDVGDFDCPKFLDSSSYYESQIISAPQEFLDEYHQKFQSVRPTLEMEQIVEVPLSTSCDGAVDPYDEANLFDRLIELVGDLPLEGDPFTPEPLTE